MNQLFFIMIGSSILVVCPAFTFKNAASQHASFYSNSQHHHSRLAASSGRKSFRLGKIHMNGHYCYRSSSSSRCQQHHDNLLRRRTFLKAMRANDIDDKANSNNGNFNEQHHTKTSFAKQSTSKQKNALRSITKRSSFLSVTSPTAMMMAASVFLLAIKPASATSTIALSSASASNILSSMTEIFKNIIQLVPSTSPSSSTSYQLTRILFLRLLAIVYTAAFSVAKFQNKGLIGDNGILPASKVLNAAQKRGEDKMKRRKAWLEERKNYTSTRDEQNSLWFGRRCKNALLESKVCNTLREKFWYRTDRLDRPLITLLWLAPDRTKLNPWLDTLANIGLLLSTTMLATGSANVPLILGLWCIQRSFMAVGGPFYGYGWEPQLAELTMHALFLVPLFSMNPFFGYFPVPKLVIWAIRWYLFKIMMGAGLIKVKSSDPKWKPGNMSAMDYFYETQVRQEYLLFMITFYYCHVIVIWSLHYVMYYCFLYILIYSFICSLYQIHLQDTFTSCQRHGIDLRYGVTISLSLWHHSSCYCQSVVGEWLVD